MPAVTKRLVAVVVAAIATVVLPGSAGAARWIVDQSQTDSSAGTECLCGPIFRLAQTFTAGITGDIGRIDVLLYRAGSPGDLVVEVWPAVGGLPSGAALATATLTDTAVPLDAPGWVSVYFEAPAHGTAGMTYALVLAAAGAVHSGPLYGWGVALGNPYHGGAAFTGVDHGSSWIPIVGNDGVSLDRTFQTYLSVSTPDSTPPEIALPQDIVVAATSPVGVAVDFAVTAIDDEDGSVSVICLPTSGSTFPIGMTVVNCSATDATGNGAHASFEVHVQGAAEQLDDLVAAVDGIPRSRGLVRKLERAAAALADGRTGNACRHLRSFVNSLGGGGDDGDENEDRRFSLEQREELIAAATRIRAVLDCGAVSG